MFTAMLGHDLRGPLSVIVMNSMVQEKKATDEAARKSATRTLESAKRMSRMIADMLDLARTRLGSGMPVQREPIDLAALIERTLDGFRVTAPDRRIEWSHRGDPNGDWDGDRLAQLASNLIGNAIQHGDAQHSVRCALDASDADELVFTVANAGFIPAEQLPGLFDPFRDRDRDAHRSRSDGLGLGLYIVEQIARGHGGRVEVRSSDAGEAEARTTFTVVLPRHAGSLRPVSTPA